MAGAGDAAQPHPDIDSSTTQPELCFEVFAGKNFGAMPDTSDSISKPVPPSPQQLQQQQGGANTTERRGLLRRLESPLDRFKRLQAEVKELSGELASLAAAQTGGAAAPGDNASPWSGLAAGLADLQGQLGQIKANDAYVPFMDPDGATLTSLAAQRNLSQALTQTLDGRKQQQQQQQQQQKTEGGDKNEGRITYELYASCGAGGDGGSSGGGGGSGGGGLSLAEAEARIARIEAALGGVGRLGETAAAGDATSGGGAGSASGGSAGAGASGKAGGAPWTVASVRSALEDLDQRLDMLSPSRIATASRQVKVLLQEMEALDDLTQQQKEQQQQQQQQGDKDKAGGGGDDGTPSAAKVHHLFEVAQRWDAVAQVLPGVVQRLKSLQQLHDQGATFTARLADLEAGRAALAKSLGDDRAVLEKLEATVDSNLQVMAANVQALEERLGALSA